MSSRYTLAIAILAVAENVGVSAQGSEIDTNALEAKITTDPAPPGKNVEGGSVFTNFVRAYNEGQIFFVSSGTGVFEKPGTEPVSLNLFGWCGDLSFSDVSDNSTKPIAYAGRCATKWLQQPYDDMIAAGAQIVWTEHVWDVFAATNGISATFVEQLNVFQGELHTNADDFHYIFWDDGRESAPGIGYESHDEGDMSPNAATSAVAAHAYLKWLSTDEAAWFLNVTADELTPDAFKEIYFKAWVKTHELEAAVDNPNAEAELDVVANVKNETSTGSTTEADAEDAAATEDPASSESGRKLASTATRVVSAVFRIFGI